MSEPVQNNQSAPAGTDPAVAASDAVAMADAAVSEADLSAALAEVDKMDATTSDGSDVVNSLSVDSAIEATIPSDSGEIEAVANSAAEQLSNESVPNQDQLDAIANQVEQTVFGEAESTSSNQTVNSEITPTISGVVVAQPTISPAPVSPAMVPRQVTPAPVAVAFQATPVAAIAPTVPPQIQNLSNQAPQMPPGYPQQGGFAPTSNQNTSFSSQMAPSLAQPQMGYQNNAGMGMQQPNTGQMNGGYGAAPGQQGGGQSFAQQMPMYQNGQYQNQNGQFGAQSPNQGQFLPQMQNLPNQASQMPPGYPLQGGFAPTSNQMSGQPNQTGGQSFTQQMPPGYPQQSFVGSAPPPSPQMQSQPVAPQALVPGTIISGPGASIASAVPNVNTASPTPPAPAPATPAPAENPAVTPPATPAPIISSGGFKTYSSLVDVLAEMQLLTPEQLNQLKQELLTTGRSYDDLLIEKKWLSEESLTKAKAKLNNLPFITIGETGISPEALSKLDESVAHRYGILPFAIDKVERKLSVAMKNPLDIQAVGFVEQKTGFKLAIYYASPTEIERIIVERYAQNLSSEVNEALKDTDQSKARHKEQTEQLNNFGGVIRDAPINRIVETILEFAVKSRASDIHIEPLPNKVRVRYRIDGILVEKLILPRSVIDAVVSRIKILGNMKIDERRIPQDGRFSYNNDEKNVDLRVSTIPTVHGEKINLRLLEKNLNVPTMEQLGLEGLSLANVKEAIKVPHGIILISGPTGSGKTTTLYSLIHILNTPKVNIVTLEDPVEYQMLGVNQVQINPKAGLTFSTGLRAFLRQDPNIIMVGEMRDRETTELAIQASLTGHLVFSTIHTSSAATALPRMIDMGAENFLIASSVTLIMAQRVVRKINPAYLEEYVPEPAVVADISKVLGVHFDNWLMQHGKTPQTVTLFRPSANRPENEPEYLGRMAIYEVLRMTEVIGRMVLQNRPASEIEQEALRNGMLLMKQDGYLKALNGLTTIEEILRVADV